VWRALFDAQGRKWMHWAQCAILTFAIAATVSRSGTLALGVIVLVFVPFLPGSARRWATLTVPAIVVALFLLVPGFITTITGALTATGTDPSISTRTNNYPRVEALLVRHPWFGLGPGNYQPTSALEILDNEYLRGAVTMGVLGLVAMTLYLWLPGLTSFRAARLAGAPGVRTLAAAAAAACGVAAVTSLTFDSMSFPVFALLYPFFVGLSGAVWNLVRRERAGSLSISAPEWDDDRASAEHLPRGTH
jgi:O-antigen ligase